MKKNGKKFNNSSVNSYGRATLRAPEVVNSDELSYMTEEELGRRHDFLVSEKEQASRFDADTRPWEVEICYVQRESQVRATRRTFHDRYMKTNPDAHMTRDIDADRNEFVN